MGSIGGGTVAAFAFFAAGGVPVRRGAASRFGRAWPLDGRRGLPREPPLFAIPPA